MTAELAPALYLGVRRSFQVPSRVPRMCACAGGGTYLNCPPDRPVCWASACYEKTCPTRNRPYAALY
jgi:hypothetical protein